MEMYFSSTGYKIEAPAGVRVQRGLCVRIPCSFTVGPGYTLTRDAIGIWYKGYNGSKSGIIAASTDSSWFPDTTNGRFIFTGKVSAGDCSFSISDAQPGDTDRYQFRLEDRAPLRFSSFGIQPSISVTELKKPDISPTEGLIAGEEVTLTCTAPTNCPGLSPTFTWEGSVNTERTQNHTLRHQDGNFSYWSNFTFTPSPRDHNSPLTCTVTYKHDSAKANITLNVEWFDIEAPAGVRVQRGLCVRIPCSFTVGPGFTLTRDAIGIWYKGYNGSKSGIIAASTDSSQFPDTTNGRFIFTGKVSAGDCSFSISDAQPGDTDRYQFRLEDRDPLRFSSFGIQPSISVTDLKEPDISPTEGLIAGEEVTLTCTAPTNCPGLSPTFTWEGSVNTERTQMYELPQQDGNIIYWSIITFTPSPRDHNSPLTCTVTYKHGSAKANITLNVEYPKEMCFDSKLIPVMVAGNIIILALMGLGNVWYLKRTKKIQGKGKTREDPKLKAEEAEYEARKSLCRHRANHIDRQDVVQCVPVPLSVSHSFTLCAEPAVGGLELSGTDSAHSRVYNRGPSRGDSAEGALCAHPL
uniref:Ig-like domain-containing protein n=1 Tax=Xenopus tropicalis TaxID=8364 RepID=F7CX65_XENTR